MSIDAAETDLRESLETLVGEWSAAAEGKGLSISAHFAANLPGAVVTDPIRLETVLTILLSNAIKFARSGEIRVRARGAHVGAAQIAISDAGPGLAPELVAAIFDSTTPVDEIAVRGARNLIAARRMIAELGGDIAAASPPGGGTSFLIMLPDAPPGAGVDSRAAPQAVAVAPQPAPAPQIDEAAPPHAGPFRMLAAEDNAMSRLLIEALFSQLGFDVSLTEDGDQALDAVQKTRFDVIVLDRRMPGQDGVEVARRLRADGPNADTPVIALTANARAKDRDLWREAGADAVLAKPLQAEELLKTLRALSPRFHEISLRAA